jgi:hypothetical protein
VWLILFVRDGKVREHLFQKECLDAVAAEFELDRRRPTPLGELIENPPRLESQSDHPVSADG